MAPSLFLVGGLTPALLMVLLLGRAASFKLRDWAAFADSVEAYRILPARLARPFARALPFVELCLGVALLFPWIRPEAEVGAAVLMALFASAMAINLLRGRREIDCGCGDPARAQPLGWGLVARNLMLAALLAGAANLPPAPATAGGVLIAVAAALGGFLLVLCQEMVSSLPARGSARSSLAAMAGSRG